VVLVQQSLGYPDLLSVITFSVGFRSSATSTPSPAQHLLGLHGGLPNPDQFSSATMIVADANLPFWFEVQL
jgi:hypothetical protein